jgi:hypothetical protein
VTAVRTSYGSSSAVTGTVRWPSSLSTAVAELVVDDDSANQRQRRLGRWRGGGLGGLWARGFERGWTVCDEFLGL